jgi:dienelactone hydrolase
MTNTRKNFLFLSILLVIYALGLGLVFFIDRDFGEIQVEIVSIPGQEQISGIIYRPKNASEINPYPAIVLAHGISGSKQILSGIALELARNGFISLTIDLVGHGDSGGVFTGAVDKTLGSLAAVKYLEEQPYVNSALIGLVGHSLGAGATRALAVGHNVFGASVYIAGGLGEMVSDPAYGVLNSTFPRNLLIIIGEEDVLFDIGETQKQLLPVFGNPNVIIPDQVYGSFSNQTARELLTPTTTHLLEPVDPMVVSEIVSWMRRTLGLENLAGATRINYVFREISVIVSLTVFVGLVFPLFSIIQDYFPSLSQNSNKEKYEIIKDWKILTIWGTLSLALLLPIFSFGFLIPFPPLIFGASFSFWFLSIGIVGLFILIVLSRCTSVKIKILTELARTFRPRNIIIGVSIFAFLYLLAYVSEATFLTKLRIFVIPMFNMVTNHNRILAFLECVPFFLVFFFVEGLYLHKLRSSLIYKKNIWYLIVNATKTIGIKVFPYLALLCIDYVPLFLLNIRLLQSLIGFLMEFIVGLVPLFMITVAYSWWFYHKTANLGMAVILNSLLFAWSAAATFPLSA